MNFHFYYFRDEFKTQEGQLDLLDEALNGRDDEDSKKSRAQLRKIRTELNLKQEKM